MKSMEELFHTQLQGVYFAEKQLLKALPSRILRRRIRSFAKATRVRRAAESLY